MKRPALAALLFILGLAALPFAASAHGYGSWGRHYGPPVQRYAPPWGAHRYVPPHAWNHRYHAPRYRDHDRHHWRERRDHRHRYDRHRDWGSPGFQPRGGVWFQYSY